MLDQERNQSLLTGVCHSFYELVQYWVAFDLVKIFSQYGLTPTFNENLKEWSSDLHCLVQLLSKTTQTKKDKECATQCIDTLFNKDTTENWGDFGQSESGTKSHLLRMPNFALPLVILTWQRMLLEHFHNNSEETFFQLGNYSARAARYAAAPLNSLYLIRRDRVKESHDTQFFLALTALRSRKNCLFFGGQITSSNKTLIWRPTMKKARLRAFEIRPMKTYKMTTNAIKWKIADEREPDNTRQQVTSPSKGNEENYDCSKDKKITLLKNMTEALDVSKRYYEHMK